MAKYFTYEGKQVGFVRRVVDEVVMIEEAWISELNKYFAKNGYDPFLTIAGRILQDAGHPAITRAQAWVVLDQLTSEGVPQALRDHESDEEIGGAVTWLAKVAKTTAVAGAEVVDTVVTKPVAAVAGAILPDKEDEPEEAEEPEETEEAEEAEEAVEDEEPDERDES